MPDGHFSRDGHRPLLLVALGRQRVGKTALLNTIVQYHRALGSQIEVWNADQQNRTHSLSTFFPDADCPSDSGLADAREWIERKLRDQAERRHHAVLDAGGGFTGFSALVEDVPVIEFLAANGVGVIGLFCVGPEKADLDYLDSFSKHALFHARRDDDRYEQWPSDVRPRSGGGVRTADGEPDRAGRPGARSPGRNVPCTGLHVGGHRSRAHLRGSGGGQIGARTRADVVLRPHPRAGVVDKEGPGVFRQVPAGVAAIRASGPGHGGGRGLIVRDMAVDEDEADRGEAALAASPNTAGGPEDFAVVLKRVQDAAHEWGVRHDLLEGKFVSALLGAVEWLGRVNQAAQAEIPGDREENRVTWRRSIWRGAEALTKATNATLGQARSALIGLQVERENVTVRMIHETMPMFAAELRKALVIRVNDETSALKLKRGVLAGLVCGWAPPWRLRSESMD